MLSVDDVGVCEDYSQASYINKCNLPGSRS